MKHVGVRSNAKDIVSQEQLATAGDFLKNGTVQMTGAFNEANPGSASVSAADGVINGASIAASNTITVVGDGPLTGMAAAPSGAVRLIKFGAAMQISQSLNFQLLTGASIQARVNDIATMQSVGSAQWQMVDYQRGDGTALVGSAGFTEAQVRATPMTGVVFTEKTSVVAADTLLTAIGKLQAQITSGVFRIETIATSSVGQTSYAVPNGYTVGSIIVFFNGALMAPADFTATDGVNVVLASGSLTTSDIMSVVVIGAVRAQDDALLSYTVAQLNTMGAAANARKVRWCVDVSGGPQMVVSNGTNWVRVQDLTTVTT